MKHFWHKWVHHWHDDNEYRVCKKCGMKQILSGGGFEGLIWTTVGWD